MKDMLGNEVNIGDTVVHFNNLYDVLFVGNAYCKLKLKNPSKTTRPKNGVYHKDIMLVPHSYLENYDENS